MVGLKSRPGWYVSSSMGISMGLAAFLCGFMEATEAAATSKTVNDVHLTRKTVGVPLRDDAGSSLEEADIGTTLRQSEVTRATTDRDTNRRHLQTNDVDLGCMCRAFDQYSTRNDVSVDRTGRSCSDGFLDVMAAYSSETVTDGDECDDLLSSLPPDYCGYPPEDGDEDDADPWDWWTSNEIDEVPGDRLCSSATDGGLCPLDTYDVEVSCVWANSRKCSWDAEGQRCHDDDVSPWFRQAYGITQTDCNNQDSKYNCIRTWVINGHCTSDTVDGVDENQICPSQNTRAKCGMAGFVSHRSCRWYRKEVRRDTTHADCCDTPYVTPRTAGDEWCGETGRMYVDDGRISAGVYGSLTCDDFAGTYVRHVQSRQAYLARHGYIFVNAVDKVCCVDVPTASPTIAPSDRPSVSPTDYPSGLPSWRPSSRPSAHPTANPTAMPTSYAVVNSIETTNSAGGVQGDEQVGGGMVGAILVYTLAPLVLLVCIGITAYVVYCRDKGDDDKEEMQDEKEDDSSQDP